MSCDSHPEFEREKIKMHFHFRPFRGILLSVFLVWPMVASSAPPKLQEFHDRWMSYADAPPLLAQQGIDEEPIVISKYHLTRTLPDRSDPAKVNTSLAKTHHVMAPLLRALFLTLEDDTNDLPFDSGVLVSSGEQGLFTTRILPAGKTIMIQEGANSDLGLTGEYASPSPLMFMAVTGALSDNNTLYSIDVTQQAEGIFSFGSASQLPSLVLEILSEESFRETHLLDGGETTHTYLKNGLREVAGGRAIWEHTIEDKRPSAPGSPPKLRLENNLEYAIDLPATGDFDELKQQASAFDHLGVQVLVANELNVAKAIEYFLLEGYMIPDKKGTELAKAIGVNPMVLRQGGEALLRPEREP